MPLPPLAGTLGYKRATHLLHRATFGATKDQVDTFKDLSASAAVQALFLPGLPDPLPPIDPETGTEWVTTGATGANSGDTDLQDFFKGWFIAQMMSQGVPETQSLSYSVREKVVFFMHSVLTAITTKIDSSRALYFQNQLFRLFAFDKTKEELFNFKELTKKISVDNAMLRLLDGNLNVNGSPNENYARELFELYTIGRGLERSVPATTEPGDYFVYREADVQAAAKVLSGWDFDDTFSNIDPDTGLPRGKVRGNPNNASGHDNTVKTFSDRFNGHTIQRNPDQLLFPGGTTATEATAYDEVGQLIEMIYSEPETAKNVCRRIYRFYVYHDITPEIDGTIIEEMANTFTTSGFKLQPVLEDLFLSQHFYEAGAGVNNDNFGGVIKSPLDLMIGTLRFFGLQLPDNQTEAAAFYEKTGQLLRDLSMMGMHFYEPYDVAGYDAYHQFPIYHRAWISTNYLTNRYNFIRSLQEVGMMEPGMLRIDAYQYVLANFSPGVASNARTLIIELAKYLLPLSDGLTFDTGADAASGLTAERLNYFLNAFLKDPEFDTDPEGSWTFRWNNSEEIEVVIGQLRALFNAMMQTPEYQLY
jgi:uncharacterized protein (DUF1800 family)